jgi:hypothetical protein
MKAKLSRAVARVFWFIGERLFTVSEAFESLGDRINLIGVSRAPPTNTEQIFSATLRAHSDKMTSDAIKKNALLDDKTVGGIDRRPSWWRR